MNKTYKVSGGLHGVGISAVNALSSEMIAEVRRSGYLWRQTYREGAVVSEVEQVRPLDQDESTGLGVTFTPDFAIMDAGLTFNQELIVERLHELAYLLPEVTFSIENETGKKKRMVFNQPSGIAGWVAELNKGIATVHPILYTRYKHTFLHPDERYSTIEVHLALQFRQDDKTIIRGFVNTVETIDGGTHIDGLLSALGKAIYGDDTSPSFDGLVAILHIYHEYPQFESLAKIQLINPEVEDVVTECVGTLNAENPDLFAQLKNHFQ